MKIRTNFVTNSSSYSSAEIKIDNPVLLEILKKYNEMGAFEGTHIGGNSIGVNAKEEKTEQLYMQYFDIDESELEEMLEGYDDGEVALFYYEPEQAEIFFAPRGVEDIIGCLLRAMAEDEGGLKFDYPESYPAFEAFKAELSERKREINENYRDVIWLTSNDGYGEFEPEEGDDTEWEFTYHDDPSKRSYDSSKENSVEDAAHAVGKAKEKEGESAQDLQVEKIVQLVQHVDNIDFDGKNFVFVRNPSYWEENDPRHPLGGPIMEKGGLVKKSVSGKTNYFVIWLDDEWSLRGAKARDALAQIEKGKPLIVIEHNNLEELLK